MHKKRAQKRIKAEKLRKQNSKKKKLLTPNNSPSQSPGKLVIVTCKFFENVL